MQTFNDAIKRAQVLLGDSAGAAFTSEKLMAYMPIAYDSLRAFIANYREGAAGESVVEIPGVPIGTKDLGAYLLAGQPLASMITPLAIKERQAGGTPEDYVEMAQVDDLPDRSPSTNLETWELRGGNVYFIGATQAIDLKVRFTQYWAIADKPESALAAVDAANILGYILASLAEIKFGDPAIAANWKQQADLEIWLWINGRVKASQGVSRHPRPYNIPDDRLGELIW